jgi:hypothetical protein
VGFLQQVEVDVVVEFGKRRRYSGQPEVPPSPTRSWRYVASLSTPRRALRYTSVTPAASMMRRTLSGAIPPPGMTMMRSALVRRVAVYTNILGAASSGSGGSPRTSPD